MFIMLCGLPSSGKSTWAEVFAKIAEENNKEAYIVSSDAIREELWGDESIQRDHTKVFELARKRIINALRADYDYVVFDATNITRKNRNSIMSQIKHIDCEKRCIIFAEPYHILCERNRVRERRVPEDVIWKMLTRFEVPLFTEGFDEILIVNYNQLDMNEYIEHMRGFNQDNPHHSSDLFTHCHTAAMYLHEKQKDKKKFASTTTAAMLHDIGKLFTKTYTDYKGNPSDVAHYYGHEKVGGYYALLYKATWSCSERLMIAQLICYHMVHYEFKGEAAEKRWKERLGSLYPLVMLLHEADEYAH